MDQPKTADKTRTRSPAYPAITLEDAIAKADLLYQAEHEHFANIEAVAAHWSTTVTNGYFQVALAALKQFGLLIDEGKKTDRRVQLTDLAKDVLEHPADSPKRRELIQAAALMPKIHRELWGKYKGKLPPDVSIRLYLIREREGPRFNKNHVDSFIAQFRATIAYAGLTESDTIPPADDGAQVDGSAGISRRAPAPRANAWVRETTPPPPQQRRATPMQPGIKEDVFNLEEGSVVVQYPERLTQESFDDFESYLQLVIRKAKRSIVTGEAAQDDADDASKKTGKRWIDEHQDDDEGEGDPRP